MRRLILLGILVCFVEAAGALGHAISGSTVPVSRPAVSIELAPVAPSQALLSPANVSVREIVDVSWGKHKHKGKGKGDDPVAAPEGGGFAVTLSVVLTAMALLFYAGRRNIIVLKDRF